MGCLEILAECALPPLPAWTGSGAWEATVPDLPPRFERDLRRCIAAIAGSDCALEAARIRFDGAMLAALALALWLPATLPAPAGYATRRGWRHGFALGSVAWSLAPDRCASIWRGALGDAAGRLLLATRRPDGFSAAAADAAASGGHLVDALDAGFGCRPADLGALLVYGRTGAEGDARAADALAVADWLLAQKRMHPPEEIADPPLTPERLSRLGLSPDALVEAIAGLSESVERARRLSTIALERR